jgi:hypothetical protein
MTRTVTGAVDYAIVQDHVEGCHLVEIYLASGTVYVTDCPHNLLWNSNTYIGVGAMGMIKHAAETDQIEATPLRFTLAGPISAFLSIAVNEKVLNRDVRVYVAFFLNGVIYNDPVLEWRGRGDIMHVVDNDSDLEGGDSVITFTAESRYAAMLRPKKRVHNNEDQQIDHPGDRFYEFQAALVDRELVWPAASFFEQ